MTFVEVKFECINWWGNEVYRTKNGTPILRLEDVTPELDSKAYAELKNNKH